MTPIEKANELVEKFYSARVLDYNGAKQCALIAVEEIIEPLTTLHKPEYTAFDCKSLYSVKETEYETHLTGYEMLAYWSEVKSEIEKL
jgi:hypothetical protein